MNPSVFENLAVNIRLWSESLGFQQVGITDTQLGPHGTHLKQWLDKNFHGEMSYMAAHGDKRSKPAELIENTYRIISLRMNYLPQDTEPLQILGQDNSAYVARYTMGRDYHKVIRKRLAKLWQKIATELANNDLNEYSGRVFTDSAPVLEKAIAAKAGLGWIGKNTLLLNRQAGSWFFLGEIYTDIPLPVDSSSNENHCGTCTSCIDICPTDANVAPYQLDARRCISYLTIEHKGTIEPSLRKAMGNRIFGCDDCQLFCPWNKFAKFTTETDFSPRHKLDKADLLSLFSWDEAEFLSKTEGSAIRRTGFQGWQRNLAIALGNARFSEDILGALYQRKPAASEILKEHIDWAIQEQQAKARQQHKNAHSKKSL